MVKDLTGNMFGSLVVVKRLENYRCPSGQTKIQWLCRCSCGRSDNFLVRSQNLTSGKINSCFICGKERQIKKLSQDITGKTFGNLTVLKLDHIKNKRYYWLCKCSCGKSDPFSVQVAHLKTGHTKYCEQCGNREGGKKNTRDLTNKEFGFLKILRQDEDGSRSKRLRWLCYCDPNLGGCGSTKSIANNALFNGQISCGNCIRESVISRELKKYCESNFEAQKEYKGVRNPRTNKWLRFDIFLPKEKIFVEVNGRQHYQKSNGWFCIQSLKKGTTPSAEFKNQKYKDGVKKRFAKKNGIYVEIDLRKVKNLAAAVSILENVLDQRRLVA